MTARLAWLVLPLLVVAGGCASLPKPSPSPAKPRKPPKPRTYSIPAPPRPGLHGSGIISTKALPSLRELSRVKANTVTATTKLGFAVTVEDTGDWPEANFRVILTIEQSPSPIVQTKRISAIKPGERKTVVFRKLGQVQFATPTHVKVDVEAVPGEENTTNNFALYPTVFSL